MIWITRLDGTSMVINAEHIEWIEHTPDTLLSLVNGEKVLVRETPEQVIDRTIQYKRAIHLNGPRRGEAQ